MMRSITRTLTISLSLAAAASFLVALAMVIWINISTDLTANCEATTQIIARNLAIGKDNTLALGQDGDLLELQADNPQLWYAVSSSSQFIEYQKSLRPSLPFDLPYVGLVGQSMIRTSDQKGAFCSDGIKKHDLDIAIMAYGSHLTALTLAKNFILHSLAYILIIMGGFATIVTAGVILSARFVAKSIERVTKMALAIVPDAPGAHIALAEVPSELVALVSALNRAFDEIDGYMRRQRRFLGNAAHELRTPLTLLRGKVENVADPALRTELIGDVRRLTSLVAAMLDLARLKDDQIEKEAIDLQALTREVLADFAPLALNCGVDLSLESESQEIVWVDGVGAAIRSALANVVGNALIHAHGATHILAKVSKDGLTIADDGRGLAQDQAENFIEPFQKGDASTTGVGLGLSIVREIMIAHGGALILTSSPGSGTSVFLRFRSSIPAPALHPA